MNSSNVYGWNLLFEYIWIPPDCILEKSVACFAKHTSLNFNALAEMLLYPSQQTRFTAFTASYRYQPLTLVRTSH